MDLEGGNAGRPMIACIVSGLISGGRVFGWRVGGLVGCMESESCEMGWDGAVG